VKSLITVIVEALNVTRVFGRKITMDLADGFIGIAGKDFYSTQLNGRIE
jgi:hypothetical protein